MRLFIAIPLDAAAREVALDVQAQLKRRGVRGRYSPPENLHLTLAFIGEYADADGVLDVLRAEPLQPFELRLRGIGAFGDVWWLGIDRCDALDAYVRALRHALADAGIPFDRKRFSPHITLLRRADRDLRAVPGIEPPPARMTVRSAVLMRSDRGKGGMIYTEIR